MELISMKLRILERESRFNRKYFIDDHGDLYYSDAKGFELKTGDWNHDGDVYSIYGMLVKGIRGGWDFISKEDFDLRQISRNEFRKILHDRLDDYFSDGTDKNGNYYYCDSTDGGKIHYGNYSFMSGGSVIYGTPDDREEAIQKEIDYLESDLK